VETVSAEGPAFNEFVLNNQSRIVQLLGRFANLPEAARAAQFRTALLVLRNTVQDAIIEIDSLPGGRLALCAVVRGIAYGFGFGVTGGLPVDAAVAEAITARLAALSVACP
jgi:hypothetical protein